MRIEIVGGGSIGMLLAGKLTLAGNEVVLCCRTDEQAQAIARNGLTVYDQDGVSSRCVKLSAIGPARAPFVLSAGFPDWLFVTVKQKDITESFIAALQSRMGERTGVLCFQNGIGHIELMARTLPPEALYAAVTTEAARRRSPSEVAHTGCGETRIGRPLAGPKTGDASGEEGRLRQLRECLEQAGFSVCLSNNIDSAIWNKFLINAVINPLTAVLRVANGELLRSPAWTSAMRTLFDEGQAVARKLGVQTAEDLWEQLLSVCKRTAANHSSMLQDVTAGRQTELDWITGSLLRLAESNGVSVPSHRMLYLLVKGLERQDKPDLGARDKS